MPIGRLQGCRRKNGCIFKRQKLQGLININTKMGSSVDKFFPENGELIDFSTELSTFLCKLMWKS